MPKILDELPKELMDHLNEPNILVVATADDEGKPAVDLLSWVMARDSKTVRLVISPHCSGGKNLLANGRAALQLLGTNLAYEVRGTAKLVKEQCESVKFPETMFDLNVEQVEENMFPATHLTGAIPYARDEGTEELHRELDAAIAEEMRTT
ncbi:MAG: pyridoxamine 5'-phosphate oxidase family protein [Anaerolineae bacterium]